MRRQCFCTVATQSHYARAQALGRMLSVSDPMADYYIFLVDGMGSVFNSVTGVVDTRTIVGEEFVKLSFQYNAIELCCALKPYIMSHLLDCGYDEVVYLDGDIIVLDSFCKVFTKFSDKAIILTPHITKAYPVDEKTPCERDILKSGIYNAGFIGVKNEDESRRFLSWFKNMIRKDCYRWGLDQKWLNLVPMLFDKVYIENCPGCNLGVWNFHERELSIQGKTLMANGVKVVFIHTSGYDYMLRQYSGVSRDYGYALNVLSPYLDKHFVLLKENGFDERTRPYRYDFFTDGSLVTDGDRKEYARNVRLRQAYANPFDAKSLCCLKRELRRINSFRWLCSRLLHKVREGCGVESPNKW